jgi:cyclopropane-fatty-acyl-phospholipid synthase
MILLSMGLEAVERGLVPDRITRAAIRRLCRQRRHTSESDGDFLESLRTGPIAPDPAKANDQHYELPPEFFGFILGPRRKYSCCYWPADVKTLDEAEQSALEATSCRGQLSDGQDVLELGCGWGSLSLWMAERFSNSHITAVSNSRSQTRYIDEEAAKRGLGNLQTITADMNTFSPTTHRNGVRRFDRIVSVEMFEHMRNYELLLERIASWLHDEGKLFVHLFCHRSRAYPFEAEGAANWMGRHFFTGGIMPSADLLRRFNRDLTVTREWFWDGTHYQRTAEAWLANLDRHRERLLPILGNVHGLPHAPRWLERWRLFFLSVGELFGYECGTEWIVLHSLLEPTR